MLGKSDAWSTSHLTQRTSEPAYYIVDCWIYSLLWASLEQESFKSPSSAIIVSSECHLSAFWASSYKRHSGIIWASFKSPKCPVSPLCYSSVIWEIVKSKICKKPPWYSRPFNLHPDLWFEKSGFVTNPRFCKLGGTWDFSRSPVWKKGWVYSTNQKKAQVATLKKVKF